MSYSEVLARMYDGDYEHFRNPSGDVEFYVEEARRAGGPVLEFACGTGRILIPTAKAGVEITGVDLSEPMVQRLRSKLPEADVHVGNMGDYVVGRKFKLVTIPFRAIAHIVEPDDQVAMFENMRRHLAEDGRLIFDFFHPHLGKLAGPQEEALHFEREENGAAVRRYGVGTPHPWKQLLEVTLRWEIERPDGSVEHLREGLEMRWYYRFELEHLLKRAGLEIEHLWGGFDRSEFGPESNEMIFVAKAA